MTLEQDIAQLYDEPRPSSVHLYARPIVILLCCIAAFYAFRVFVIDGIVSARDGIDIYTAENRMEEGNFSQAEEILNQILDKQPNFAPANRLLGFLYLQQDKLDQALIFYKKALPYSPDSKTIENAIELINKRLKNNNPEQ